VVTGEGTVDATSTTGKAPGEALRICIEEGTRCVVFGGRVLVDLPGAEMVALSGDPARSAEDLLSLGKRLADQS
jgi:glycerate kinase